MKRTIALVLLGLAGTATAQDADTWLLKVGVHEVNPKSDNGRLANGALHADVSGEVRPTITAEYLIAPEWGVEVLASWPFRHEVSLNGAKAASVKHLPPTVSLQYHFNPAGKWSPFVGLGLNYTYFFGEHTTGPLQGHKLSLDNSFGAAVHLGVDYRMDNAWIVTVDARWMSIDAKAKVDGADVGTVHIDPFVYGIAIGRKF